MNQMVKWRELELRLRSGTTIDAHEQKILENEKKRWHDVLCRILDCIQFLAERNLAFRGEEEN